MSFHAFSNPFACFSANVKKLTAYFLLTVSAGCAHNPPTLNEYSLRSAPSYLDILKSNITDLEYNTEYDIYAKWQTYDALVGFDDLKKPKAFAEQYCSSQGGKLTTLDMYGAPIPPGLPSANHNGLLKHLNGSFGLFNCSISSVDQWRVEVEYGNARVINSLLGSYGVTLFVTYTNASDFARRDQLKRLEKINTLNHQQKIEKQAIAENKRILEAKQAQTTQNKKLGATVCLHASSLSTKVVMAGTVENLQGDKIKVFDLTQL